MGIELSCFKCGNKMHFAEIVSRKDECDKCHSDALCCKNCEFYDSKSYNECRETQADPVREKERANFCGFFKPKSSGFAAADDRAKLMNAAEALFKKK